MSSYIMDLRQLVGHRPLMQVGASVLIVDAERGLLLQKRKDNACWGYHGGAVELDESVEAAAARELEEETGLIPQKLELLGVFSGPALHYQYPNGDEVSNVEIFFVCRQWSGTLKPQKEEVLELKFFQPSEIPVELNPPNRPSLAAWLKSEGLTLPAHLAEFEESHSYTFSRTSK